MHRLLEDKRVVIERDLDYSPEQLEVLSRIEYIRMRPGFGVNFTDKDRAMLCSVEGISAQLDSFTQKIGMIYWVAFDCGTPRLMKAVIELSSIAFYGEDCAE